MAVLEGGGGGDDEVGARGAVVVVLSSDDEAEKDAVAPVVVQISSFSGSEEVCVLDQNACWCGRVGKGRRERRRRWKKRRRAKRKREKNESCKHSEGVPLEREVGDSLVSGVDKVSNGHDVFMKNYDSADVEKNETSGVRDSFREKECSGIADSVLTEVKEDHSNLTNKKLLCGPRYFDQWSDSWESSCNCGKQGHNAAICTTMERKNSCFQCGMCGHNSKCCPQDSADVEKAETSGVTDYFGEKECSGIASSSKTEVKEDHSNLVLKKLLRGPRYFDPWSDSWEFCCNCGKHGHNAASCTTKKKKKPCFLCAKFGHDSKCCAWGQDCFLCKRRGHFAKNCPDKHLKKSPTTSFCLRCGDSGHEMTSCTNDYPPEDLQAIQCYICKEFGHLCCANFVSTGPQEISCYNCGLTGHTGAECPKLQEKTNATAGSTLCRKMCFLALQMQIACQLRNITADIVKLYMRCAKRNCEILL